MEQKRIILLVFWNKLRELLSINSLLANKLDILSYSSLRINIFEGPKNFSVKIYNEFLCSFLALALGLMSGSRTVLRNNVMRILVRNGLKAPTIAQIITEVRNDKESNIEIKRRIIQRLNSLREGIAGQVFREECCSAVGDMAQRSIGIALDEFDSMQKNVLLTAIMSRLVLEKKEQLYTTMPRHLLVMDDWSELLSASAGSFEEEENPSILEKMATEYCRECKINLIMSTQTPFNLNRSILENSGKFISFRVGSNSKESVRKQLNLDYIKGDFVTQLGVGQFLSHSAANFPHTVFARAPLIEFPEISMEEYRKYRDQPAEPEVSQRDEGNESHSDDNDEVIVMMFLRNYWWCTLSEIADRLGKPISKISLLCKSLAQKDLINMESFAVGKGVGNVSVVFFSPRATSIYGPQQIKGKAKREHQFWQKRISLFFESHGYRTEIEKFLDSGESVDVMATKDGVKVGIEVGINKMGRELHNIAKLKDFDQIIWASRSEVTIGHIQELVNSKLPELRYKVLYMLLKDFLHVKGEQE